MSSTQANKKPGGRVALKLEVFALPVSNVDRAKRFYESLGWRVDIDLTIGQHFRGVQVTPPYSPCSIIFGKGITQAAPGSMQGLILVVDDIEAARTDLLEHGAEVSPTFHFRDGGIHVTGTEDRAPGPDSERRSYFTWASFNDPDGNGWLLQEVIERFPGRLWPHQRPPDVSQLTELLREAEEHHGEYERSAPKHHWSDWYAAYVVARHAGGKPEDAAKAAALHIQRK